ncbi:hypothetical protein KCP76_18715 [Salmonella enterica subsp. enterica serovar Weltevreden]|nr:hypothetical protein KCP76_18715 [Salmonella enterica subsp. enterica serovar Weltevreden]
MALQKHRTPVAATLAHFIVRAHEALFWPGCVSFRGRCVLNNYAFVNHWYARQRVTAERMAVGYVRLRKCSPITSPVTNPRFVEGKHFFKVEGAGARD